MALGSVEQEAQDHSGFSCGSDVCTGNGCGPVGLLHCRVAEALRPINALGNIPDVGLHPTYRASLSLSSQQFPVTGGICKQGIRHRITGALVLLRRLRGAGGFWELLRGESQIRAHFLTVFAGTMDVLLSIREV